jgi:hypothetical protein
MELLRPHASLAVVDTFLCDVEAAWGWQGYYPHMSVEENIEELQAENAQVDDYSSISEERFHSEVKALVDEADVEARAFYATLVAAATAIQRAVRRTRRGV